MTPLPTNPTVIFVVLFVYLSYVRYRRYQRIHSIEKKYRDIWKKNTLTLKQAQEIFLSLMTYDCPHILILGAQVALLKAFIPQRMAELLLKTGQLAHLSSAGKRAIDTEILIWTWMSSPFPDPDCENKDDIDPRAAIAIARVNFLHRRYKIDNDEYRYTLALLINEPMEWLVRHDWRKPTDMERDASFLYWKRVGELLGVQDIWDTREDMLRWLEEFRQTLTPSQEAHKLLNVGFEYFMQQAPSRFGIPKLLRNVLLCLVGEETRKIAMLPTPPRIVMYAVQCLFMLRKLWVRYLCLPRRAQKALIYIHPSTSARFPRLNVTERRPDPWYWPEPTGFELLLQTVLVKIGLLNKDKLPGPKYKSEGYRIEELGPIRLEKDGIQEVFDEAARLQGVEVTGPWSIDGR